MLPCADFDRAAATINSMQEELQPKLAFTAQPGSSSATRGDAKGKGTKKGKSKVALKAPFAKKWVDENVVTHTPSRDHSGDSEGEWILPSHSSD